MSKNNAYDTFSILTTYILNYMCFSSPVRVKVNRGKVKHYKWLTSLQANISTIQYLLLEINSHSISRTQTRLLLHEDHLSSPHHCTSGTVDSFPSSPQMNCVLAT